MSIHRGRRRILLAAIAGGALAALATVASSRATPNETHELFTSTSKVQAQFAPLSTGTTYRAGLVRPTPSLTPAVAGWLGTQYVSRQGGRVRYQTAALIWRDAAGGEIDVLSGPAMAGSPAATLARPRARIPHWNFSPYDPPGPVKRWTVAHRRALYFDATAPPPGVWTLVGSNPPELRIDHDHSFRMAAFTVRGRTVVLVIQAPAPAFVDFLPIAKRLVSTLQFPSS